MIPPFYLCIWYPTDVSFAVQCVYIYIYTHTHTHTHYCKVIKYCIGMNSVCSSPKNSSLVFGSYFHITDNIINTFTGLNFPLLSFFFLSFLLVYFHPYWDSSVAQWFKHQSDVQATQVQSPLVSHRFSSNN